MQVPLTAYSEDCSFTGELALTADRLSDFLASTTEFEVVNLACRALEDGRLVPALFASVLRDDLYLVVAGEPRGREDLRVWTRPYPVVARVGPYRVRGYVHAPPTIDPLRLPSRRPILPLTAATIEYTEAGTEVEIEVETVLLNSTWIESLEAATAEELGFALAEDHAADAGIVPEAGIGSEPQVEGSGA